MASPALILLQRLVLRSARTPLRALWALLYRGLAWAGAAHLTRGETGAAVYQRGGGPGSGDFLPGLSDIDLVVVVPEDAAGPGVADARIRHRWERVRSTRPWVTRMLDHPRIHEQRELEELAGASALTYGLNGGGLADRGFLGRRASNDTHRALLRPGLYGRFEDWRRVRGPERRPPEVERDDATRRIAGWLEVSYSWRLILPACLDPAGPRSVDRSLKSVGEIARVWLWLAHGRRVASRAEALRAALDLLPEERGLQRALGLCRELPATPEAPLGDLLPTMVRITARVAALLDQADQGPARGVALVGEAEDPDLLPLVDWRALSDPVAAEELFFVIEGNPDDPALLRRGASRPGNPHPAVLGQGLMVLPSATLLRAWTRAVQCPATAPVSFALAAGKRVADFPATPGWSAEDVAGRAVIEHRAWLRAPAGSWRGSPADGGSRALEVLLTAARAGLFLASLEGGDPELCLTAAAIGSRLPGSLGDDAVAAHRAHVAAGDEPDPWVIAGLREAVGSLPAYAASERIRSATAGRPAIT